ncbi:MAG: carboxypeptidase-like regulatory domain-containing protein, partial [Acidobacteriota bacterium]
SWREELGAVDRGIPGPLVGIEVSPPVAVLESGEARPFEVHGVDPQGRRLPVPGEVRWTASGGGAITDAGLFTGAKATGLFVDAVTVTVEADGAPMEATASVLVRRRSETPAAPQRVVLERSPVRRFGLSPQGRCCVLRDFTTEAPAVVAVAPPALGDRPHYTTMPFGDSELPIFIDDLGDGEYLARIDLDRDGDLAADPVERCRHRESCGPFEVATGSSSGFRHGLMLRYFTFQMQGNQQPVLWATRADALAGEIVGQPIAVVDDDTDGRFDGADDLVLIDLNGDGELSGSSERLLHHSPLFLGDRPLRITEAVPGEALQLADADYGIFLGRTVDIQNGRAVAGARVRLRPGEAEATSDTNGYFALEVPAGRYDSVALSAAGFWGQVVQGEALAGHYAAPDAPTEPLRILLSPGPCPRGARWCGQETLSASSVVNSHLDLETGLVGPRPGPHAGPLDLAWSASGGLKLQPMPGARLAHFGVVDFAAVSSQAVLDAATGEASYFAGPNCADAGKKRVDDGVLRPGSILGAVTAEGNVARVRVEKCGFGLQLSWIVE